MKRAAILSGILLVTVASVALFPGATGATPRHVGLPKNPLSISGYAVAGVTANTFGGDLVYDFTVKNHGRTGVDIAFSYTFTNATAVEYLCPQVQTGAEVSPDTPDCEPGILGAGGSTQAAIIIAPVDTSAPSGVSVCADDQSAAVGPPKCVVESTPAG